MGKAGWGGQKITAGDVFTKLLGDNDSINRNPFDAAKMIDDIGIGEQDWVLSVGPGSFWSHIVACAIRGAHVDIVQPLSPHNEYLTDYISLYSKGIKYHAGLDVLSNIDMESYQTLLEDVNIPTNYYSYVLVLNVLETIHNGKERFVQKLFSALKDESSILISAWISDVQKEIDYLKQYAKKHGYQVNLVNSYGGSPRVYELRVFRNPKVELPPKSPAEQAL